MGFITLEEAMGGTIDDAPGKVRTFGSKSQNRRGPGDIAEPKYLEALMGDVRRKPFLVYDVETKDGEHTHVDETDVYGNIYPEPRYVPEDIGKPVLEKNQRAGFTRPFRVGAATSEKSCIIFENQASLATTPWVRRHLARGGCIDKLMRWTLTPRFNGFNIYAHNGGSFDHLFILAWLVEHAKEYGFEVMPVQSTIQMIRVWRRLPVESEPEKPSSLPIAGPPKKLLKTSPKDRKHLVWTFLDSMRLMPMGLDKAAKSLGLEGKQEMDLHAPEDDPLWNEYLRIDNLRLFQVMTRYHDLIENKLKGEVGITAPATAMKLFRRRYLGRNGTNVEGDTKAERIGVSRMPIYRHFPRCEEMRQEAKGRGRSKKEKEKEKEKEKSGDGERVSGPTAPSVTLAEGFAEALACKGCFHKWVRRAYCGGRTEIHQLVLEKARYFDINSSYVAAMLEGMPVGDLEIVEPETMNGEAKYDRQRLREDVGFVEAEIYIPPDCELPPIPCRAASGKLIFPAGHIAGVWDADELELLSDPIVGGHIERVRRVAWIGRRKVFDAMMLELWRLRDKKLPGFDKGLSALAKLMGNSLYGKFGMKEDRVSIVFERHHKAEGRCLLCESAVVNGGQLCGDCQGSQPADPKIPTGVWYQPKRVEAPYMIPQVSAHVTSLARIRLWRWMRAAKYPELGTGIEGLDASQLEEAVGKVA